MRMTHLRYFCAVCREGSVSNAAKELFVSEPTVSVAIRELEGEYGVSLFRREKKRLLLTEEGRIFYERATGLLSHADELDQELRALAQKRHPVRVGTSPVSSISVFLPLYAAFRAEHPKIDLEMVENGTTESMNALETHRIDCAFVVENTRAREQFDCIPMLISPMMFCCGRSHRLAERKSVHITELAEETLILPRPEGYTTGSLIHRAFAEYAMEPHILFSTQNLAYQTEYMQWDRKACTIAMSDFGRLNPGIVAIPLEPTITSTVSYIRNTAEALPREAAIFDRFVREFAELIREAEVDS